MISYEYIPKNICSSMIRVFIDEDTDTVKSVAILGGCHGNLQGIGKLVEGMDAIEVIAKLGGIRCGYKDTSCPDQLSKAIGVALTKM